MPKFSTHVSSKMDDVIADVKIRLTNQKGPAVGYVLHLARLKPDHPIIDFGTGAEKPCNYGMAQAEYELFTEFRLSFSPRLTTTRDFFAKALAVGCSAYEGGYRLSDRKAFELATLVGPMPAK